MNRDETLNTAQNVINGQRARDYGDMTKNFRNIADLWEPIFGVPITNEQVALAMIQVKVARLINTPAHDDSWVDVAGYAALGAELGDPRTNVMIGGMEPTAATSSIAINLPATKNLTTDDIVDEITNAPSKKARS